MILKYRNELIVLAAFMLFVGGFLYQKSTSAMLDSSLSKSKSAAREIKETKVLQKVWSTKGIKRKIAQFKSLLPSIKVKKFDQEKNKLDAEFIELTGKELNQISTSVASTPVHIEELAISRSGDKYNMRCRCTW